jgi:hypothetical protein
MVIAMMGSFATSHSPGWFLGLRLALLQRTFPVYSGIAFAETASC